MFQLLMNFIVALKRLTDDACTTEKGRPFQTGIVLGKNEYLFAFTEADRGINLKSCDLLVSRKPRLISDGKKIFTKMELILLKTVAKKKTFTKT